MLATLLAIATSFGLSHIIDKINQVKNSKTGTDSVTIANIISQLYNDLAKKGNAALSELNNKLSNIPYGSYSGVVKDAISKARKDIQSKISKVEEKINNANTAASGIEREANALSMMSDSYRSSKYGRKQLDNLKDRASNLVKDFSKVEETISK